MLAGGRKMRIFSGIQPTGVLHIGNYLGAIRQWLELQQKAECIFCIVDWHSLTIPYEPKDLQQSILEKLIVYLASGIEPERSIIFVQSQVKEHTELSWLLGTITPIGELLRMTQYKEKSKKFKKDINAGLLNYPVLMAADILLYKTDTVPVGRDQQQHVELAKVIAKKFNQRFGEVFKIPEAKIPEFGAKIMSLTQPEKKMSKTDKPESYIALFDSPEIIRRKIMSAKTDLGKEVKYNPAKKPGISNLLTIYSLFSNRALPELEKEFKGKGYAYFKRALAELLINSLESFHRKKKELESREIYLKEILEKGKKRAQTIAQSTMAEVREKMGLR